MASLPLGVRLSMRSLRIIWIAVFVTHAVIGFLLYRWRALFHGSTASLVESDWIVFGIPFWLAFGAYWLAFTFSPYLRPRSIYRYAGLTVLSLAGAFFCFLFYMLFAVNTYGT